LNTGRLVTIDLFIDHIVGYSVLFPGVGYVELVIAFWLFERKAAAVAVTFVRPCVLTTSGLKLHYA
jgi:hypothetical protein